MNGELLIAIDRLVREKGLSKEVLFEAIESALVSAARKAVEDKDIPKEEISVSLNKETGEIKVFGRGVEVRSERFGRIAAQTAKQVIMQKIREAERDVVYEKYLNRSGNIVSGLVHRFGKGDIIVELDDVEAVLPKSEQAPHERFRQGENVRAYLKEVKKGTSGLEVILSRASESFVKKLFEMEVPEISQGIVEIKAIAREAGERTKVAVYSHDEKIDAVGACVGMRGSRVKDIVKELHGERIDVVRWSNDIREYIAASVSPAEIVNMFVDSENKTITIAVFQDQLSQVIGRRGRNIRLASKLIGWELNAQAVVELFEVPLADVKGLSDKVRDKIIAAGYDTTDKVAQAGAEKLMEIEGVGEKTAEKIMAACQEAMEEEKRKRAQEAAAETPEAQKLRAEAILPQGAPDEVPQEKAEEEKAEEVSAEEASAKEEIAAEEEQTEEAAAEEGQTEEKTSVEDAPEEEQTEEKVSEEDAPENEPDEQKD